MIYEVRAFLVMLFGVIALPSFSDEVVVKIDGVVKIAGRTFGEKRVAVYGYDQNGEITSRVRKYYTVLLPLDQEYKDSLAAVSCSLDGEYFKKCILEGRSDVTHHKLVDYVNNLRAFSDSILFRCETSSFQKLTSTVFFTVRRALEIVLLHMKHDLKKQGFSPKAHEFVSKREFDEELKNVKDADRMFQLYLKIYKAGINYASSMFDEHNGDINVAVYESVVRQWCRQLDAIEEKWPRSEREKYANYMRQVQQNQNQMNAQMLQLIMMNHQQNMNVNAEVNQRMRSVNSMATPKVRTPKGYCARHNCHYELTQGCHYCNTPNYGNTNPRRIRGNWDGDLK